MGEILTAARDIGTQNAECRHLGAHYVRLDAQSTGVERSFAVDALIASRGINVGRTR